MRASMLWIVQIQKQFKGLSLPHCARFSFIASHILLQEINTLSSPGANLNQIITQIWFRLCKPLNQLNWYSGKLQGEAGTFGNSV